MRCRKAVLLIHGFAGGTYDMEELANYLELNRGLDVYYFTLPGHDTRRKDSTKKKWIEVSEYQVERLINNGYHKIYIIGHSMGGVIACHLATKYKQVKRIVLLAPSFKYFAQEKGIINRVMESADAFNAYDNSSKFTFITKVSMTALMEFRKLVEEYQDTISKIKIPTLIVQGTIDKIVPTKTGEYVFGKIATEKKMLVTVNNVGHEVIRNDRYEEIKLIINSFLSKWNFRIKKEKIKI